MTVREQLPSHLVLTDWHWLHETGQLDPEDSQAHRVRLAAPRMGMSTAALGKALERAGITNPAPAPTLLPRTRPAEQCQVCRNNTTDCTRAGDDLRRVARNLAADPDSSWWRERLEPAREALATIVAHRDAHLTYDHPETELVA